MKLRILHTADWHLGQRFFDRHRQDKDAQGKEKNEHQVFLDWLLLQLSETQADALLVSGDVFDVRMPPSYALEQYYNFLRKAADICPNIIITGGNHDSPQMLNAPRDLLRYFAKIHVLGGVLPALDEHIVEIHDRNGRLLGAVAAVPFLHDTDLYTYEAEDMYKDRSQKIKDGIRSYFHNIATLMEPYNEKELPLIAMAHLFAAGLSDEPLYEGERNMAEKEIYLGKVNKENSDFVIGNLGVVGSETFPDMFAYVALGHIHKPMIVNQKTHIRYSGSPIPLSFSERNERKQVLLIEFENASLVNIQPILTPITRRLMRFKGDLEKIQTDLANFTPHENELPTWAEIEVLTDVYISRLDEDIKPYLPNNFTCINIKQSRKNKLSNTEATISIDNNMDDMTPEKVFEQRCRLEKITVSDDVRDTFAQLVREIQEMGE